MSSSPPAVKRNRATWALVAVAVLLPVGIGVGLDYVPPRGGPAPVAVAPHSSFPPSTLAFEPQSLGQPPIRQPRITNVRIVDLDKDGRPDVLVCDAQKGRIFWHRRSPDGKWDETAIGPELNAPCGATPVDLDDDGDLDLVVPVLGSVLPTDDRVGQVVWLENRGGTFERNVLLNDVRRVSDVQAGDLDGDGDIDLAVAVFGYDRGEILWLENRGQGKFRDHLLFATQGPSHVPLADYDGDGDLDIAALVSQDHEEIWGFDNDGKGNFTPRLLHHFVNFDIGGAGLIVADVDKDGKPDLVMSAGDNLEINYNYPQPWHGCFWFRNLGGWKFEAKRAGTVAGVYATAVADFDGDGDNDLVCASMCNDWRTPGTASLVWLQNDGQQNFTPYQIADRPSHLATVAAGDLDGDGRPDIVAGSLGIGRPFDRVGRVTLWLNKAGGSK